MFARSDVFWFDVLAKIKPQKLRFDRVSNLCLQRDSPRPCSGICIVLPRPILVPVVMTIVHVKTDSDDTVVIVIVTKFNATTSHEIIFTSPPLIGWIVDASESRNAIPYASSLYLSRYVFRQD